MPFNGADTSTSFLNEGSGSHVWTAAGNAQIDTAQSRFGGSSGLFDGTGDFISTPNHANFNFGSGDFTIDLWVRFNAVSIDQNFIAWSTAAGAFQFGVNDTTNQMFVYGETGFVFLDTGTVLTTGQWYHIALERYGNAWTIFVNGVIDSIATDTRTLSAPNHANGVYIGGEVTASSQLLNGWIDDFRVSKGVARYQGKAFRTRASRYTTADTGVMSFIGDIF